MTVNLYFFYFVIYVIYVVESLFLCESHLCFRFLVFHFVKKLRSIKEDKEKTKFYLLNQKRRQRKDKILLANSITFTSQLKTT